MFALTAEQLHKLNLKHEKKTKLLLTNGDFFGLDKEQCLKYLNVNNQTFHEPRCNVVEIKGDKALVNAVFHSGVIFNDVRAAWIPLNEIKSKPSVFVILSYCLLNLFKNIYHKFNNKKY